ncbi:hypothetical protein HanRHA438_Chr09g0403841 [Helianthus annuus]|nr:hypothetical protein HanRHA438_Chr09g0403841 [Helianthus annuus]
MIVRSEWFIIIRSSYVHKVIIFFFCFVGNEWLFPATVFLFIYLKTDSYFEKFSTLFFF